jgi:hypothetical protein
MTRWFRIHLWATLVCLLVVSVASFTMTPTAQAATSCNGKACKGKGPVATGCAQTQIKNLFPTVRWGDYKVDLRYSAACRAAWARVTVATKGMPQCGDANDGLLTVEFGTSGGGGKVTPRNSYAVVLPQGCGGMATGQHEWTLMVPLRRGTSDRARVYMCDNYAGDCTGVPVFASAWHKAP